MIPRLLMFAIPVGLIVMIFLYMNTKAKLNAMQQAMMQKDSKICDMEREIADLKRTIRRNMDNRG